MISTNDMASNLIGSLKRIKCAVTFFDDSGFYFRVWYKDGVFYSPQLKGQINTEEFINTCAIAIHPVKFKFEFDRPFTIRKRYIKRAIAKASECKRWQ